MPNVQTSGPAAGPTGDLPPASQPGPEFENWLSGCRRLVEGAFSAHLAKLETGFGPHSTLPAAVQYCIRVGGKRLRPILVLESCRVCGGRDEAALAAGLALECVHTFSLIHDDLPAMDNDDLRRGQPTCHKAYGEAVAILAGDWLATHAFALLAAAPVPAEARLAMVAALADGTQRMIDGQAADVAGEGRPADGELVGYIHGHKTAALLETGCRLGVLCAGAGVEQQAMLSRYGNHLGLAFQIADDLLDAVGSEELAGKRLHKDAVVAKQTYPAIFGLDESRAQARREIETAVAAVEPLGERARWLRALAWYVIARDR